LWQGGTDHAGIATQKIVENQLAAEGRTRHDLGRATFIERVWQWKDQSGSTITNQMRRLGASVDWTRERFTMDEGLSAAVRRVFVTWYRDGLIYRGKRLVHWDPLLMTAVSDLEVNNEERDGSLWSIRYDVIDPQPGEPDHIVVATTRPETMLGDVAVAVHPDDERYAALVANQRRLMLPLAQRPIPVIADDYVEREFGTGAVKITPAHDFNDYKVWERHAGSGIFNHLPQRGLLSILDKEARILSNSPAAKSQVHSIQSAMEQADVDLAIRDLIPEKYRGMPTIQARKEIISDLTAEGLLVETHKHKLQVPVSQRSDAVIEPMLTDQWFLDLTSETRVDGKPGPGGRKAITEPALAAVRDGHIRFVPDNWATTYNQWLGNIQDWCVSRQLWWGHRIPAWYDEAGNIFVGEDEADAVAHSDIKPVGAMRQDEDVLDTWFSSALWPFSTMGWPGDTPERAAEWDSFKAFVPSNVLVTGFDIIFFWVARMVMATQYFVGRRADGSYEPSRADPAARVPFREVYINAIVRDAEGQKMSKSKGNTIDPLDLIDGIDLDALVRKSTASLLIPQLREKVGKRLRKEYPGGIAAVGADALRFTFAALATYGRTINFDLKRADGYRNFCNKLWNAARFVLMNVSPLLPSGEGGATAPDEGSGGVNHANSAGSQSLSRGERGLPATEAERWILTRLHHALAEVEAHFATYRFDLLAQALYEFVWNDYCDWFLELAKPALAGEDAAAAASMRHTLLVVLEAVLRALHPLMPFITEEIWGEVAVLVRPSLDAKNTPAVEPMRSSLSAKNTPASMPDFSTKSISTQAYPRADDFAVDEAASAEIEWLKAVLGQVRRIRSEMNIAPGKTIPLLYANGNAGDRARTARFAAQIGFLARAQPQRWLDAGEGEPPAAAAIVGDMKVLIPLAGLIDLDAEKRRLDREIKRLEGEIAKSSAKLANFKPGTPAGVVEQERQRLADFNATLSGLREQAQRLAAM
jgi:valyl-tRNA synthetase